MVRVYDERKLIHTLKGHRSKSWPIKSTFFKLTDFVFETTEQCLLLCTGSSDPFAYVYAMNHQSNLMIQRLEGHTDKVYSPNFHPTEPILATGSGDSLIKLWTKNINVIKHF